MKYTTASAFIKKNAENHTNGKSNRHKIRMNERNHKTNDLVDLKFDGFSSPPYHHRETLFSTYGESVANKKLIGMPSKYFHNFY